MKDFAQYTSRLPSPNFRRKSSTGTGILTPRSKTSTPEAKMSTPNKNKNDSTMPSTPQSYNTDNGRLGKNVGTNPEETIKKLRDELKDAMSRDDSAKAALSKSDAVILDLRSNQRQLKRQLDLLHEERAGMSKELQKAKDAANTENRVDNRSSNTDQYQEQIKSLQAHINKITQQLEESQRRQQEQQKEINSSSHSRAQLDNNNKNEKVGELQVQLDRAHAQILTADMVRKELEDTLEAEQYTWELRVQDQERQITRLQQDCDALASDLEQCRSQWKEAEVGWNQELNELKNELSQAQQQLQRFGENGSMNGKTNEPQRDLFQKIQQLESERAELQSCLDEALKELEAVDAQLQTEGEGDGDKGLKKDLSQSFNAEITESLKHLLRWIYQEGPVETRVEHKHLSSLDNNPKEVISLVQKALEDWLEATSRTTGDRQNYSIGARVQDQEATIDKLNEQISLYEEELKNRDGTSAELRESLKEAVSLLKPLQDAVAQTEEEKTGMLRQLTDLERDRQSSQDEIAQQSRKINSLEDQISELGQQLEEEKRLSTARHSLLKAHSEHAAVGPNLNRSDQNDSTMNQSVEENSSLANIKRAREELRRKRETEVNLQKLLKDAQSRFNTLHDRNEDMTARNRELQGQIERLGANGEQKNREQGNETLSTALAQKDEELRIMRLEIERMRLVIDNPSSQDGSTQKNSSLKEELDHMRSDVAQKEQVNRVLNKSLKEALGLLKPLQMHLEEAEMEKADISKELRNLRKRFRQLQMGETDDHSRSTHGGADVSVELIKIKDELEETVRQLELENSQLHDALDDMTEDGKQHNIEAKLRQRLVELNSRYEVTQNKLEDAHVENHALVKALKQKEMEEKIRKGDIAQLEGELRKTETELINAKKIAQSALVKVEELTVSNIEQLSNSRDSSPVVGSATIKKARDKNGYAGAYSF
mmetsp:Transcript_23139/g.54715  ORF Transcript_23139/g.54715 Transcript_23139/m.54715 type:complete len:942 (-) Transcript_23139:1338-4163(-)|eukprot:CAMPEP_0197188770 /NCGR_PEP_ID=MMETSP1423-20130617/18465_1 /TAXON_ID=476441 /ORGANISM="Pseudo-nitzschia heimii, Strain UNC1101" /LENGTH=941 /DNA_ID=CAMNT_0042640709 /DNA_START=287 /DNA_END=3112 /DNA_ORIENTATION=-